eukprot:3545521-Rhodomonas_salina.1
MTKLHPITHSPSDASSLSCCLASSLIAASCCMSDSHSSHTMTRACVVCHPPFSWLTRRSVQDTPLGSSIAARCADHHLFVISSPVLRCTTAIPAVYQNSCITVMSSAILVALVPSIPNLIRLTASLVFASTAAHSALQDRSSVVQHPKYLNGSVGFNGKSIPRLSSACLRVAAHFATFSLIPAQSPNVLHKSSPLWTQPSRLDGTATSSTKQALQTSCFPVLRPTPSRRSWHSRTFTNSKNRT